MCQIIIIIIPDMLICTSVYNLESCAYIKLGYRDLIEMDR